jgi:FkbM family methyltransferase
MRWVNANPLPAGLPPRLRLQFTLTRLITSLLRALGLREGVIRVRAVVLRARRQLFERVGSARYSRPALYDMDRKLDEIINRHGGYFVEAGAHDGYTQSNTYYLERFRGWHGVLIEPMRELAHEARRNRPGAVVFECALVAPGHPDAHVEMNFGDLFSNVQVGGRDRSWAANGLVLGWREPRSELVAARPLSHVLDEAGAGEIDLLSLDVEGYEAEALKGLDLARHAPAWILVEMHDLNEGRAAIGAVLGGRYVEHQQLSPLDVLYRRVDAPAAEA